MLISYQDCIKYNKGQKFNGVIHIGAHLGEECKDYKDNGVKKVIWVDANPKLMEPLVARTRLIATEEEMQQKYFAALMSSVSNENKKFYVTNNGQSSSMLELGTHKNYYPDIYVTEVQEAVTVRFDDLMKQANIDLDGYDFVNLDIQGAELEALKGFGDILKNPQVKAVYTEVNFEELYVGAPHISEITKFLEELGFKLVANVNTGERWGDALYLRD